MADTWIIVPRRSYDGIKQGVDITTNKKDYIEKIKQKEQEESKQVSVFTEEVRQTKVEPNDVSEITKKKHGGKF